MIARRGMTLAEVMIAIVLIGIVGAMFTKMLVAQGRFFNAQYGQRSARSVSRAPMNFLLSELRMVQDRDGVDAAQADGKRVRLKVPYRFGVICGTAGDAMVASMLPVDSAVSATYAGWAWRAVDGSYTEVVATAPLGADSVRDVTGLAGEATCTAARIHKPIVNTERGGAKTGRVLELRPASATGEQAATPGEATAALTISPVYLWQYVAYEFKASAAYPGRIGLYRIQADGTPAAQELELMAPFDTSARFKFFVPGRDTSQVAVPATLATIRGLELVLNGAAGASGSGGSAPAVNRLTTAVFFKNVRTF
ncbi:MAG: prepilin-type N-terminal cleavage/methylation domain-containing protein [Gemmatimonadota bacterium]|nr:prepilin-type N-terminal cleavage/methylation domain-containing protein [Gemmatimonadota bacterium]